MAKPAWAVSLSQAIKAWCQSQGYPNTAPLRDQLAGKVTGSTWDHIIRGDIILNETSVYAEIFYITGLSEADPRTIPPLRKPLPQGGESIVSRSWSTDDWLEWLTINHPSEKLVDHTDLDELLSQLIQMLELFVHATAEQRNQLMAQHGFKLGNLFALLGQLTLPEAERESALALAKRLEAMK